MDEWVLLASVEVADRLLQASFPVLPEHWRERVVDAFGQPSSSKAASTFS
jgi:hypothetical protein